jgi:ribosomal-protein-serine acetyltransferase
MESSPERELDEITSAFYRAFSNASGTASAVDVLYDLFMPEALIVKNVGAETVVYDAK